MKLRGGIGNGRHLHSQRESLRSQTEARTEVSTADWSEARTGAWSGAWALTRARSLLAIGVALLAIGHPLRADGAAPRAREAASAARTLKVPWPRTSSKHAVFAALSGGRIQVFDLEPLYDELLKRPAPRAPQRVDLRLPDVSIRFYPITNEVYCFQLRPKEGAGESWAEAALPGSAWQRTRTRFGADRHSYFFWVAGDSFETFRALRDSLRREHVEVGWKPVRSEAPLEICQGVDGGSDLAAQ